MKYRLIQKDPKTQPVSGVYSDWKEQIANECHYRCVYCSIHEEAWGGINNYHIDHFRPKSKFKVLENDICNLFYSCPICNRFKSDDWPCEPDDLNKICYPDPSKVDYSTIFQINIDQHLISGFNVSSQYIIERLYLNRPQLLYYRREAFLTQRGEHLIQEVLSLTNNVDNSVLIKEALGIIGKITVLLQGKSKIRPYKLAEIRKRDK